MKPISKILPGILIFFGLLTLSFQTILIPKFSSVKAQSFNQTGSSYTDGVNRPDTLKVMTYNIWNGFDLGKDSLRQEKLRTWVNDQKPSVVALQELLEYTPERLEADARSWGHEYSVLLKESGYSVGLTSAYPITVKEKIREGLHHGALHAETAGIDFLVLHLHPGSIDRRMEERDRLIPKLEEISRSTSYFIVIGDFNAHSPFDAHLYDPDGYYMNRMREIYAGNESTGNLIMGDLDYSVISSFLAFPLYDVIRDKTSGMAERGTFPGRVLGPVNNETPSQLTDRLERIDYILVSRELKELTGEANVHNGEDTWYLSDHYPVTATFYFD